MFKRFVTAVKDRFFNDSLPFESRMTSIFLGSAFILSVLSATENITLNIKPWHNILQIFTAVICGIAFFRPNARVKKFIGPLLLYFTFVYFPYCFFFNSGINGTVLLFVLLSMYINAMMFKGIARTTLIVATVFYYSGLFVVQYLYPALFLPYTSVSSRFGDYIFSFAVCIITLFWMTQLFTRSYETERKRSGELLLALEENNQQLERLSIRDPLTGVFNRRHLVNSLELELENCNDATHPLCILMMDLDHFKAVNDTYGHGFGDEVLSTFAKTSAKDLREYDIFARYGGEEFVMLLPVCQPIDAYHIAQRIRQQTEELTFRVPVRVTVSIGLAVVSSGDTAQKALERADQQLYIAKQNGRNNVACSIELDV